MAVVSIVTDKKENNVVGVENPIQLTLDLNFTLAFTTVTPRHFLSWPICPDCKLFFVILTTFDPDLQACFLSGSVPGLFASTISWGPGSRVKTLCK